MGSKEDVALEKLKLLIDANHIQERVEELAAQIESEMTECDPLMVITLKGGLMFGADLLRALERPWPVVFIRPRGEVAIDGVLSSSDREQIRGKDLLIVDALMDTGGSVQDLINWLKPLQPASIRVAVLLHRTVPDPEPVQINYLGFEVPNMRLVGYGLDENHLYRGMAGVHTWWKPLPADG
ncbi:MAG: hypothetical protein HQL50_14565 [Magnetococcales bacterium]|nr:hypothetical protein [Magnetococcales bacterium]